MIDPSSQLIRKYVEVAKQLNVYLLHFPKHEKYALVNTIKNDLYQVFRLIIEGQKRYHKKTTLTELDIAHEQLRMQLYLAYELGYFKCKTGSQDSESAQREQRRWLTISRMCDELGRMIGGWIKSQRES